MRDYLNEWNTGLMSNNPVLHARLAQSPGDGGLLTTEELERRLGLKREVAPRSRFDLDACTVTNFATTRFDNC